MRYEVLGPMRMWNDEGYWTIGTRKLEALLGVLLLRADHMVTIDQLTEEIWGEKPPRRAMAGLHGYVSQLRKHFRDHGDPDGPIVTQPSGYVLQLGEGDELDTKVFLRLVAQARAHRGRRQFDEAAKYLADALAMWRGPVLGGALSGPIARGYTSWLTEARIECAELFFDVQLELGRHREVLGMLHSAVSEHPLRENFYRQLMLALYRAGCRAEALNVFQSARTFLRGELGLEPGRDLRVMQQWILNADPRLDPVSAAV
jgi:SARP family transcriptional regulator, regulator of embCAB operon